MNEVIRRFLIRGRENIVIMDDSKGEHHIILKDEYIEELARWHESEMRQLAENIKKELKYLEPKKNPGMVNTDHLKEWIDRLLKLRLKGGSNE